MNTNPNLNHTILTRTAIAKSNRASSICCIASVLFFIFILAVPGFSQAADTTAASAAQDSTVAAPNEVVITETVAVAPAPVPNKGDVAWMLICTALVLMMCVPALALFYGGLVRTKNILSMLMQVFVLSLLSRYSGASTAIVLPLPKGMPFSEDLPDCF